MEESMLLLERRLYLQLGVTHARFTATHDNSEIPDEGGSLEDLGYKLSIASHWEFGKNGSAVRLRESRIPHQ
jgi:hypothetical protein